MTAASSFLISSLFVAAAYAHNHGGDTIQGDTAMDMAAGTMTAFLHLFPGDTLWIDGWVPGKSSTLWGACVALILLGIGERWVAAARAGVERSIAFENNEKACKDYSILEQTVLFKGAAPFLLSHAWARGSLQMIQATLGFLFMLAVMTYQVGFILSLVLGLGIGEMLYGRFTDAAYVSLDKAAGRVSS